MPVATLSCPDVRTRDCAALAAFLAALAAAPLAAEAAKTPQPKITAASLWATVDVCNTAAHPDAIGIRGSMPGTGDKHEKMYMRFVVEYRSASGHWQYFKTGGQSAYVEVGDADSSTRQAGQDFELAPNISQTYVLRGAVLYEWRLKGRIVASSARSTSADHDPAAGSDPPGFSAATCMIQPNNRGSLVITPVTPRAARRSIRARSSTVHT
jgi:hypothetical protein